MQILINISRVSKRQEVVRLALKYIKVFCHQEYRMLSTTEQESYSRSGIYPDKTSSTSLRNWSALLNQKSTMTMRSTLKILVR